MRSDVGAAGFDPWPAAQVHVEWGPAAARQATRRGDLVALVDVLSFSTTLTVAAELGCTTLVYAGAELEAMGGREAAAAALRARPPSATRRAPPGGFSLSPASLLRGARPGERLLVTSLNGAACVAAASGAPLLVAAGLRNARAAAALLAGTLTQARSGRVTLVACGERWPSVDADEEDGLRPGLEDLVGAGAIAAALAAAGLALSPEAQAAAALADLPLAGCVSARELLAAGYAEDVELALARDATRAVPASEHGRSFSPR